MQNLQRLIKLATVSVDVSKATTWIMNSDGLCACGRWLSATDAKFVLANIGPHDSPDPMRRDVAVIAGYCFSCYQQINDAMKKCSQQAYREKRSEAELRE